MALGWLLAMQAMTAEPTVPPTTPGAIATIDFDLARIGEEQRDLLATRRRCDPNGDAIIVCGRRPDGGDYPLAAWERLFALAPPRAEARLFGNSTVGVELEQVELQPGLISNRVMLRLRTRF